MRLWLWTAIKFTKLDFQTNASKLDVIYTLIMAFEYITDTCLAFVGCCKRLCDEQFAKLVAAVNFGSLNGYCQLSHGRVCHWS